MQLNDRELPKCLSNFWVMIVARFSPNACVSCLWSKENLPPKSIDKLVVHFFLPVSLLTLFQVALFTLHEFFINNLKVTIA